MTDTRIKYPETEEVPEWFEAYYVIKFAEYSFLAVHTNWNYGLCQEEILAAATFGRWEEDGFAGWSCSELNAYPDRHMRTEEGYRGAIAMEFMTAFKDPW